MTEAEMNAILAPVEALEIARVEADLKEWFESVGRVTTTMTEYLGPDTPVVGLADDVLGWEILGNVFIERHMLPVEGSPVDEPEDDGPQEHRRDLLDIVRGAFDAGRAYREPVPPLPIGHEEGDPEAIWLDRLRALFGNKPPASILTMHERLRGIVGPGVPITRQVKEIGLGWQVGEAFLDLVDVSVWTDRQILDAVGVPNFLARGRAM